MQAWSWQSEYAMLPMVWLVRCRWPENVPCPPPSATLNCELGGQLTVMVAVPVVPAGFDALTDPKLSDVADTLQAAPTVALTDIVVDVLPVFPGTARPRQSPITSSSIKARFIMRAPPSPMAFDESDNMRRFAGCSLPGRRPVNGPYGPYAPPEGQPRDLSRGLERQHDAPHVPRILHRS